MGWPGLYGNEHCGKNNIVLYYSGIGLLRRFTQVAACLYYAKIYHIGIQHHTSTPLHCPALHYTTLYYTTLYPILQHIIPYHITQYYSTLQYTIRQHTVSRWTPTLIPLPCITHHTSPFDLALQYTIPPFTTNQTIRLHITIHSCAPHHIVYLHITNLLNLTELSCTLPCHTVHSTLNTLDHIPLRYTTLHCITLTSWERLLADKSFCPSQQENSSWANIL